MLSIVLGFIIGLSIGFGFLFFLAFLFRRKKIHQIEQQAEHIVQVALNDEELNQEHILNQTEQHRLQLLEKQEKEFERLTEETRWLKSKIDQLQHKLDMEADRKNALRIKKSEDLDLLSLSIQKKRDSLEEKKTELKKKQSLLLQSLQDRFELDLENLKSKWQEDFLKKTTDSTYTWIKKNEETLGHNLNKQAHFILELALNRFQNPYCAERGIRPVLFANRKSMEHLLGSDFSKIKLLEKECGVDMKVNDKEPSVTVFGIDPVRRELGRASLQRISKRRFLKAGEIKNIVKETKQNLFLRIKSDGQNICRKLNLQNIKTEIKNMMGALRYRYSFAQNQYFHCREVAWLCGLLHAELRESIVVARRAGMLHDIGKAMDYSKDGGHAVIGAEFIEKHGESAKIVYAVKAHHHDVAPEEPLDFLVIAADALSGARPGARRSTVDSYNQKVSTLEKIGKSFKGVKDTYIMSAGREVRVIVDSQQINDRQALELSKKIARKIEEECSYPGLIKVTVLRTVTQRIEVQKLQQQMNA